MDREKVIKGLECCTQQSCECAANCPYSRNTKHVWMQCRDALAADALALLKAQEPIEARLNLCESCTKEYAECEADKTDLAYGSGVGSDNIIGCPWYANRWKAQEPVEPKKNDVEICGLRTWDWACPVCNTILAYRANYCSGCGRAVKWE